MRTVSGLAVLPVCALVLAACGDSARPTAPVDALRDTAGVQGDGVQRVVNLLDACDPTTFDAVIGPGTCVRNGGVTFSQFIAELQAHGSAAAWRFAPSQVEVREGDVLTAVNRGGEEHTFTEVEHFGGGIVPTLNQLSGNTVPAPECLALSGADFIAPGGSHSEPVDEAGDENYQCCIHPWMRAVVHARER